MRKFNIITATDSYKVTHWPFYPEKLEYVRAYFEARLGAKYRYTIFFSLQYILKEYFCGVQVTKKKIDEAEKKYNKHFFGKKVFNRAGWEYILKEHGGKLPISIRAVREGTKVPINNVLMVVENTDPKCGWLVNYLETILTHVWYGTTVATRSHVMKQHILDALIKSGDPDGIMFKLHDFGFRGVSCMEQAAVGGGANLINFWGTDTFAGIELLEDYYHGDDVPPLGYPGFSIAATEHSTTTIYGEQGESAAIGKFIALHPDGFLANVGDSYDYENFVENIVGRDHKEALLARNGTYVVRPDSGDPHFIIPWTLNSLWKNFGGIVNDKGFKVLDPHVRVIQGDGIDDESIVTIMEAVMKAGFSVDNIAFGSGGGLLQKVNRDTQRFAFKMCQAIIDGTPHDVWKQPKTDPTKASKRGNLKLVKDGDTYRTVTVDEPGIDQLEIVYANGDLLIDQKLTDIRTLANAA